MQFSMNTALSLRIQTSIRLAIIFFGISSAGAIAQHTPQTPRSPDIILQDCQIVARKALPGGVLHKWFACGATNIELSGEWSLKTDSTSYRYRSEFDQVWFGQTTDFGIPNKQADLQFDGCRQGIWNKDGSAWIFGSGNSRGYMSQDMSFTCNKTIIELRGTWCEEYQGNWSYHLDLGEVDMEPQWVENPRKNIDFTSSFQKWCPTKYGYRLCGWIDEQKVDHGKAPVFKR